MAHGIDASKCQLIWLPLLLLLALLHSTSAALCELSHADGRQIFNFSLTAPLPGFPHGILSEDGFYNVANNESVLWFQLCDRMIFNHDPPRCFGCQGCGRTPNCGTGCSALVANNIDGYDVCSTLGSISSTVTEIMGKMLMPIHKRKQQVSICPSYFQIINLADDENPQNGVNVKISSLDNKDNCSLTVSVICDLAGLKVRNFIREIRNLPLLGPNYGVSLSPHLLQGPSALRKLGQCTYAAILQHPAGCATVVSVRGKGLGWFSILIIVILSVFGAYMIAGAVYRHFFLGINGLDAIPNLNFWVSLPLRIQGYFASLVRRFKGPTETYRSSYSPVNF